MAGSVEMNSGARGSRWSPFVWGAATLLLLMPLIAMQFTAEVVWGPVDFLVFGTMLAIACGTWELAVRSSGNLWYRAGVALAVVTAFLLVWANLAVGYIGDEGNPANLMFAGVLLILVGGSAIARFRPIGMAHALNATALAHALVCAGALYAEMDVPVGPTIVFVGLWLGAGLLFRKAAAR